MIKPSVAAATPASPLLPPVSLLPKFLKLIDDVARIRAGIKYRETPTENNPQIPDPAETVDKDNDNEVADEATDYSNCDIDVDDEASDYDVDLDGDSGNRVYCQNLKNPTITSIENSTLTATGADGLTGDGANVFLSNDTLVGYVTARHAQNFDLGDAEMSLDVDDVVTPSSMGLSDNEGETVQNRSTFKNAFNPSNSSQNNTMDPAFITVLQTDIAAVSESIEDEGKAPVSLQQQVQQTGSSQHIQSMALANLARFMKRGKLLNPQATNNVTLTNFAFAMASLPPNNGNNSMLASQASLSAPQHQSTVRQETGPTLGSSPRQKPHKALESYAQQQHYPDQQQQQNQQQNSQQQGYLFEKYQIELQRYYQQQQCRQQFWQQQRLQQQLLQQQRSQPQSQPQRLSQTPPQSHAPSQQPPLTQPQPQQPKKHMPNNALSDPDNLNHQDSLYHSGVNRKPEPSDFKMDGYTQFDCLQCGKVFPDRPPTASFRF
ncbi:UNVERIFIED_CONTAM: hypothetical protein HDU68_005625 [Siphonaria sp. JEL0065]|nr:hypothetical protein HDU68_005625 [Siphonaria sp. JEL0065]